MKLDISHMRYLSKSDFRVLTAVEMGSKNHEVVPTTMILSISGLRNMAVLQKSLSVLSKINLINREKNQNYDGWKLTYHGYDYLALKAMVNRDAVVALGTQIGIGKESDIYTCADARGHQLCLKVHRLGRVSFKAVKNQRDYLGKRQSASWTYLSRLSAQKEWGFMVALHNAGFSVPEPIDTSRHHVVMSLIDGIVLRKVAVLPDPARVYALLMDFASKLANQGLVHCDFNEFNIMICEYDPEHPDREVVVIDFPQCVSIDHPNAQELFERDINSIRSFFSAKFNVEGDYPKWADVKREGKIDMEADASGANRKALKELEKYQRDAELMEKDGELPLDEDEGTASEEEEIAPEFEESEAEIEAESVVDKNITDVEADADKVVEGDEIGNDKRFGKDEDASSSSSSSDEDETVDPVKKKLHDLTM